MLNCLLQQVARLVHSDWLCCTSWSLFLLTGMYTYGAMSSACGLNSCWDSIEAAFQCATQENILLWSFFSLAIELVLCRATEHFLLHGIAYLKRQVAEAAHSTPHDVCV